MSGPRGMCHNGTLFAIGSTATVNDKINFNMAEQMIRKRCEVCGGSIYIYDDNEVGDEVYCEECEKEFIVLSLEPVSLEPLDAEDDYYFEDDEY